MAATNVFNSDTSAQLKAEVQGLLAGIAAGSAGDKTTYSQKLFDAKVAPSDFAGKQRVQILIDESVKALPALAKSGQGDTACNMVLNLLPVASAVLRDKTEIIMVGMEVANAAAEQHPNLARRLVLELLPLAPILLDEKTRGFISREIMVFPECGNAKPASDVNAAFFTAEDFTLGHPPVVVFCRDTPEQTLVTRGNVANPAVGLPAFRKIAKKQFSPTAPEGAYYRRVVAAAFRAVQNQVETPTLSESIAAGRAVISPSRKCFLGNRYPVSL